MKNFGYAILIFALWFLLSGQTGLLMLSLGIASMLLTVYLAMRMDIVDHESYPVHISMRLLRFWVFLGKEITLANFDVLYRILKPGKSISPQFFLLKVPQQSNLGKVIYANAITLTPGTVSVQMDNNCLRIHALSRPAAEDLLSNRMASRVPDKPEEINK